MGRVPFKAHNIFAEINSNGDYVVFSYGYHFPMYAFIAGKWFGNKSKYSVSTSKQQGQTNPFDVSEWVTTDELRAMVNC